MRRTLVIAGVAATGAVGYAIACWLASMTDYAERRDAERYLPHLPPADTASAGRRPA
jgi:hypothetical protein